MNGSLRMIGHTVPWNPPCIFFELRTVAVTVLAVAQMLLTAVLAKFDDNAQIAFEI